MNLLTIIRRSGEARHLLAMTASVLLWILALIGAVLVGAEHELPAQRRWQFLALGGLATLAFIVFAAALLRRAGEASVQRREAELARNRLREAIEAVPDGFALFDADDRLVTFNSAYRNIYATSSDVIREGATFTEILRAGLDRGQYPEANGCLETWLAGRLEAHRNPKGSFEQLTNDGRWLRIDERRTGDGGIVGIRADITALKDRELRLAAQTTLLTTTFEHMSEGLSIVDAEGRLLAYNRKFMDLLNVPETAGIKESPLTDLLAVFGQNSHVVPEGFNGDAERAFLQSAAAPGMAVEWLAPNDRIVELRSSHLPDGGIVTVYNDVSDRRHSAQRIRASEAVKSAIIASSIDAIIITDEHGVIREFNRAAERIFGWSAEEALGRAIGDIVVPPDLRDRHQKGLERYLETGRSQILGQLLELPAIHRNGHRFPTETIITAIRVEGRIRFSAFIRDISERKRIAAETQAAREAAEAASRAKSEFLAMVSHEFRTPMNGIIGLSSLLQGTALDGEQGQFVTGIEGSANRLLALLNEILEFSRAEAGRLAVETTTFDLRTVIDNAADGARVLLGSKPVEVDARIEGLASDLVVGDPNRIYQILHNLLANSAKFIERGRIDLTVRASDHSPRDVPLVRFEISDTGPGIPADLQDRLFEPFEQGKADIARRYGGSGLGLAICRRLVELMQGSIGFVSTSGSGATFWFELPLPRGEALPAETGGTTSLASDAPDCGPLRVLVAEDTPTSQLVIGTMLQKMGHLVQVVSDGSEAVEAASSRTFDLVLMDLQMPMLDGFEATRRIRLLPAPFGDVPIVALTAQVLADTIAKTIEMGMNGHLAKPINMDRLRAALQQWARQPAPAADRTSAATSTSPPSHTDTRTADDVEVDPSALDDLYRSIGAEQLEPMLESFLYECSQLLHAAARQAHARDLEELRRTAHTLSGLFSQFGFVSATALARQIENAESDESAATLGERLKAVAGASFAKLEQSRRAG
jgi:PAS domain S-box-containing protein